MAPPRKLSDDQVRQIRRRYRKGEPLVDLASEFGVNRRTLRRRIDALDRVEAERAAHLAEKRLRWQAQRERRKLAARPELAPSPSAAGTPHGGRARPDRPRRAEGAYERWLETPKNLSGLARAESSGLVRVSHPDGRLTRWVERPEAEALFDEGWTLV